MKRVFFSTDNRSTCGGRRWAGREQKCFCWCTRTRRSFFKKLREKATAGSRVFVTPSERDQSSLWSPSRSSFRKICLLWIIMFGEALGSGRLVSLHIELKAEQLRTCYDSSTEAGFPPHSGYLINWSDWYWCLLSYSGHEKQAVHCFQTLMSDLCYCFYYICFITLNRKFWSCEFKRFLTIWFLIFRR